METETKTKTPKKQSKSRLCREEIGLKSGIPRWGRDCRPDAAVLGGAVTHPDLATSYRTHGV